MINKTINLLMVLTLICLKTLNAEEDKNPENKSIKLFVSSQNSTLNLTTKQFAPTTTFLKKGKYKVTAVVDAYFARDNMLPAKKVTFSAITKLGADGWTWVLKDGETIEFETVDTDAYGYFVEGDSSDNSGGATLTIVKVP
jgi:hypothetical protein